MSTYVDGFLIPVPKSKVIEYKKLAKICAKIWVEYGALSVFECMADDVSLGAQTSFPQAVKLKKNETVFFSYITYKSKASRNRINKKVMSDPRLEKLMIKNQLPFDSKRMIWGGFKPLVSIVNENKY